MKWTTFTLLIAVMVISNIDSLAKSAEMMKRNEVEATIAKKYHGMNRLYIYEVKPLKFPIFFNVRQNYPNPFNISTVIEFEIPSESGVYAVIYNMLGNGIRTFENDIRSPGIYRHIWDGKNDAGDTLSSGIYFYVLVVDDYYAIRKMVLLR